MNRVIGFAVTVLFIAGAVVVIVAAGLAARTRQAVCR